ncbi:Cell division cycle protein 123 [Thelohanellus kitauei]|uniref:Cell division cycle protein 123 n=1 Tax=Thelohanellus kitauei TaxID=669202 RepID=A0A0C2ISQ9_THEKT|nr:Cell division cycle protein 123 [Thelohanellus kitauei]
MSIVDFPECFMIYKWYNVFEEYTIKTKFYRLKQEILEYINSSEFIYPSDYFAGMDSIETFKTIISKALKSLGGSAYIKLLWSSPKDSGWLCLNGRPIVDSFEDLCLVMANSDNLINDFKMISEGRIQHPNLALREPCEIDESLEFRCFIKDRQFVGCCQRNVDLFHQFLHDQKSDILKHIGDFIANRFLPKWKNEPSLILDVFLR